MSLIQRVLSVQQMTHRRCSSVPSSSISFHSSWFFTHRGSHRTGCYDDDRNHFPYDASTLDVRNTLTEQDELYRSMRVGMDRIKKELRVAFLTKQQGAIGTYQTVFIGKDGGDVDTLWFAHLSHKRKNTTMP